MVRIVVKPGSSVRSKTGTVVQTTPAGTALGSGPSIGTTSTSNNVYTSSNVSVVQPGASVNQLSSPSGIHNVAAADRVVASTGATTETSSGSNYRLSVASMLLAMKNQALGAISLGGAKAGGSITENLSGINLG